MICRDGTVAEHTTPQSGRGQAKRARSINPSRWYRSPAIATLLLTVLSGTAHSARVDYAIDAGIEHDDNVRLDPVNPTAQQIWRTGLGFLVTENNSTIQASVDGRVDYRMFQDSVYSNTVEGVMNGRLNWVMLQDRLSFTVEDNLQLEAIDRFAADSPDNRQQVNILSAGPNLFFNIGQTARGQLEARYIDTHAEVTSQFNSQRWGLALRAVKDLGANSVLSLNAQTQDVDFDNDLAALDYRRNDLYARYEQSFPNLDLGVDLGYSRLDYRQTGSRSNPLFRAELAWRASERSRFTLFAANQFSDAADAAISEVGDAGGTLIPDRVLIDGGTITAAVYEEQRVELGYAYQGARGSFVVAPYVQRLNYEDALNDDEEDRGVTAGFDYRLRPTLTLSSYLNFERVHFDQIDRTDDTRNFRLSLDKQWSRHLSTALSYTRYERTSELASAEAKQNVWYLRVIYRNR